MMFHQSDQDSLKSEAPRASTSHPSIDEAHSQTASESARSVADSASPDAQALPRLLTVVQASMILGISKRKLWGMTSTGEVPSVRVGRRSVRYNPVDLRMVIERQTTGGAAR